jgi:hypothetical protein
VTDAAASDATAAGARATYAAASDTAAAGARATYGIRTIFPRVWRLASSS